MKQKKANPSKKKHGSLPGYLCFSVNSGGSILPQRASYSDTRREEVNEIRKLGACLRCQLLKKPCSRGNPCDRCLRVASKNSASRCLSWMECVRPCLQKVSIYSPDPSSVNDLALGGVPVLQYFAEGNVNLKFDIPFQWNIVELSTFVAGWLTADSNTPKTSMVGIMSSASLYAVLADQVGSELARMYRLLVSTSSMLFNAGTSKSHYKDGSHDIKIIRYCGQRMISYLDSQLRPTPLSKLSKEGFYAMFLLLLGTTIASRYFGEDLDVVRLNTKKCADNSDKSSELLKLLCHYLVYIGQQSGLLNPEWEQNATLNLVTSQWETRPQYTWTLVETQSSLNPDRHEKIEHTYPTQFDIPTDDNLDSKNVDQNVFDSEVCAITKTSGVSWLVDTSGGMVLEGYTAPAAISPEEPKLLVSGLQSGDQNGFFELDYGLAASDPDLPTLGLDSPLFDIDLTDNWSFLHSIPSPELQSIELPKQGHSTRTHIQDAGPRDDVPSEAQYSNSPLVFDSLVQAGLVDHDVRTRIIV